MNKCDSELMNFSMQKCGFTPCDDVRSADIVIFNTCSVRQHAEDRAIAHIKSFKGGITKKSGLIVLAGCMAQRIGSKLLDNNTADIIIGPYQSPRIGEIIDSYTDTINNGGTVTNCYLSQRNGDLSSRINHELASKKEIHPWHKWVTITHGCSNCCSYCIVPYVRGQLISFQSDSIIKYIEILSQNGISEITLLGQNVNQFGTDTGDIPFYKLLGRAAQISGLQRINFITSHPKDFSKDIIKVINDNPVISRSIHLPLQSGSNRILELMNRKYTIEHYMNLIEKIDATLNKYSISTDLIVGFPGETDKDFKLTLKAVENIQFDDAFMYAYSPREGTSSYNLQETLTKKEKTDRLQNLINLQRGISKEKLNLRVNHTEEVIVERISKRSDIEVMGKTHLNHPVILPGEPDDIGKKLVVRIEKVKGSTLYGKRVN